MRLIYIDTGKEVRVGDQVVQDGLGLCEVTYFRKPHKPSSTGKVSLSNGMEYFVSVIGAKWIDRGLA